MIRRVSRKVGIIVAENAGIRGGVQFFRSLFLIVFEIRLGAKTAAWSEAFAQKPDRSGKNPSDSIRSLRVTSFHCAPGCCFTDTLTW